MAADSNSSAMKQLCDIAVCSICYKTLTDPRMLPCIHTFCFSCLESVAKKTRGGKPGVKMPCPLCRKEFAIPEKGLQEVQKNFMMKTLIEVTSTFNQRQTPCRDATGCNIGSASTRCINCKDKPDLCDRCLKENRSHKTSTDHGEPEIGREGIAEDAGTILPLTNCEIHRDKQLDVYCADCKMVVCVSCLYESHKTHDWKDAKAVEEEFRQNIGRNVTKMKRFVLELSRKKDSLEKKEVFLQKVALVQDRIFSENKKLKALIDRHTAVLLESLASIKREHLKQMQIEEEELEFRETVLKTFGRYCVNLRSNATASDFGRSRDDLIQRTEELEREHETFVLRPGHSFEISFDAFNIVDFLKRTNSNIIGEVKGEVLQKNNYLIVNGLGESDGSTVTNDLLQITLDHPHEVSSLHEIPVQISAGSAAAVYNDSVFVSGIGDGHREIWKYNLSTAWTKCGSMVQGRLWHCVEFVGKQLVIVGGCSSLPDVTSIVWKSIEAYSLAKKRCEPVGKLKYGVRVAASVSFRDSVFIFGGLTDDDLDLDCVQVYNTVIKSVSILSTRMPRPSRLMRAVAYERHAILMGQHTCFLFDIEKETWEERNQFKTGVSYFGLVLQNERVFVIGGCSMISENNPNWVCSDELKYVTLVSVFKDEFASWKTVTRLPKPALVHSYGLIAGAKCAEFNTTVDKDSRLEFT